MFLCRRIAELFLVAGVVMISSLLVGAEVDLTTEGSHERFIDSVETSQEAQFKEVVEKYDLHLKNSPEDSVAATERCHFISYFAYSEDFYIEEADSLLEEGEAYLDRFVDDPVVELYHFQNSYGQDRIEEGEALLKEDIGWTDDQLAEIHLSLSSAYKYRAIPDLDKSGMHAVKAHELDPETASQLMVGQFYIEEDKTEKAIEVLLESFPDEYPFQKKQRMNLLLELGSGEEALRILKELNEDENGVVNALDSARIFAGNGMIAEARESFAKAKDEMTWNLDSIAEEYFEFECEHGDEEAALAAYNEWRDIGFSVDPLLYHRINLFLEYPGLRWSFRDGAGLLTLFLTLVAGCLLPLVFLVPAHYWGLLRHRAGKEGLEWEPSWGMRCAWRVSACFIVVSILIAYVFAYESTIEPIFEEYATEVELEPAPQLARMMMISDLLLVVGVMWMAGFRKSFASFVPRDWSVGRSIGIAFAVIVPLRIFAGILSAMGGGLDSVGNAELSVTMQSLVAVLKEYGPFALVLGVAVLTPIIEEIVFRGVLLTALVRYIPFWWANIFQAALFTIIHEEWVFFPFLFAFGIVTGVLRQKSGGLLASIVVHAINNGLVALGLIFTQ